eukprot:scaffold18.g1895.t1
MPSVKNAISRHRSVMNLFDKKPSLGREVFVAPSAAVIGDVKLDDHASVFYGSVVKADSGSIAIGARSNVQDGCVIRTAGTYLHDHGADTVIGSDVTIGHMATLHGCTVEDEALIGMGATLQQASAARGGECVGREMAGVGSRVEKGAMVAAGAVVAPGTVVPEGEIWGGNPAKFLRKLKPEESKFLKQSADAYVAVSAEHLQQIEQRA